jgi:Co/Zn/Cd efflux system component
MDLALSLSFRRSLVIVIALNLAYFCVQILVALAIGSVSLFADSTDYLEDAAINILILIGLNWPQRRRALLGKVMAGIILLPSLAALWMAWRKFNDPVEPEPLILTLAGFGALAVNLACAFLLGRYRSHSGSLTKAAFLSARNDALASLMIIIGGGLTALTRSAWPALVIGLVICCLAIFLTHGANAAPFAPMPADCRGCWPRIMAIRKPTRLNKSKRRSSVHA